MATNINLSKQISELLLQYGDEVRDVINTVMPQVAEKTVEKLKATSPRKTGKYAAGWKGKPWRANSSYIGVTIYNSTKPQVTHLLEFDHALRNGGRSTAQPHIAPAEQFAQEALVEEVTEGIKRIKL